LDSRQERKYFEFEAKKIANTVYPENKDRDTASSKDIQGVSISTASNINTQGAPLSTARNIELYGCSGCIPFHHQQYERAGCIPFHRFQCGRRVYVFLHAGLSGIRSVRYRNEQKMPILEPPVTQSGTGIRGTSPVPEYSGAGLRYKMPECRMPSYVYLSCNLGLAFWQCRTCICT
jgi:hypothetical protein